MKVSLRSHFSKHTDIRNQENISDLFCTSQDLLMKALQSTIGIRFDLEGEETIGRQQNQLPLNRLKWQILCEKEGCRANRTLTESYPVALGWPDSIFFYAQLENPSLYFLPIKILNPHFTIKTLCIFNILSVSEQTLIPMLLTKLK